MSSLNKSSSPHIVDVYIADVPGSNGDKIALPKRYAFITDNNQIVCAAGVLIYKINPETNELSVLLIKNAFDDGHFRYDDFGGKVEMTDSSIIYTAARECDEESNGIFARKQVETIIKENNMSIYYDIGRYMIFFVCVDLFDDAIMMEENVFGDHEILTNRKRTVEWVTMKQLSDIGVQLNGRLRYCTGLMDTLSKFVNQ